MLRHHKRFSEDIDLGIEDNYATQGQRKQIKEAIKHATKQLSLTISNLDETRSRREFNRYEIPLVDDYVDSVLANNLYVETSVMTPITPTAFREVSSFIGDYFTSVKRLDLLERKASSLNCPSAEDNLELGAVLRDIVDNEAYRRGYERTTSRLLNADENVTYDMAIASVTNIASFIS